MELSFLSLLEGSLLPDPSEPAAGPVFCPGISSAGPAELRACPGRPCGQPAVRSPRRQPRCPSSLRRLPGSWPAPCDPYVVAQQSRMLVLCFSSVVTSGSAPRSPSVAAVLGHVSRCTWFAGSVPWTDPRTALPCQLPKAEGTGISGVSLMLLLLGTERLGHP